MESWMYRKKRKSGQAMAIYTGISQWIFETFRFVTDVKQIKVEMLMNRLDI